MGMLHCRDAHDTGSSWCSICRLESRALRLGSITPLDHSPRREGSRHCTAAAAPKCRAPWTLDVEYHVLLLTCRLPLLLMLEGHGDVGSVWLY